MTDDDIKPSKMCSFRLELQHIDSIDSLARGQDISRSQWFRRAVLSQLVVDLLEAKKDATPVMESRTVSSAPDLPVIDLTELSQEELRKMAEQG